MSRTKPVGFGAGPELWAYDAGLSVLLAQVLDNAAAEPPGWWAQYEEELRIQATVSDLYFDLAACPSREEFAVLLEEASAQLLRCDVVTAEEAALLRGTLADPPPGTWWYYGAPGGRSTIAMNGQ